MWDFLGDDRGQRKPRRMGKKRKLPTATCALGDGRSLDLVHCLGQTKVRIVDATNVILNETRLPADDRAAYLQGWLADDRDDWSAVDASFVAALSEGPAAADCDDARPRRKPASIIAPDRFDPGAGWSVSDLSRKSQVGCVETCHVCKQPSPETIQGQVYWQGFTVGGGLNNCPTCAGCSLPRVPQDVRELVDFVHLQNAPLRAEKLDRSRVAPRPHDQAVWVEAAQARSNPLSQRIVALGTHLRRASRWDQVVISADALSGRRERLAQVVCGGCGATRPLDFLAGGRYREVLYDNAALALLVARTRVASLLGNSSPLRVVSAINRGGTGYCEQTA